MWPCRRVSCLGIACPGGLPALAQLTTAVAPRSPVPCWPPSWSQCRVLLLVLETRIREKAFLCPRTSLPRPVDSMFAERSCTAAFLTWPGWMADRGCPYRWAVEGAAGLSGFGGPEALRGAVPVRLLCCDLASWCRSLANDAPAANALRVFWARRFDGAGVVEEDVLPG